MILIKVVVLLLHYNVNQDNGDASANTMASSMVSDTVVMDSALVSDANANVKDTDQNTTLKTLVQTVETLMPPTTPAELCAWTAYYTTGPGALALMETESPAPYPAADEGYFTWNPPTPAPGYDHLPMTPHPSGLG